MTTVSAAPTAAELLADYRPGRSTLFTSLSGTLLAEGTFLTVDHGVDAASSGTPPAERAVDHGIEAALSAAEAAGHDVRTVVGAIPFAPGAPAHLVVPLRLRRGGPPVTTPVERTLLRAAQVRAVPAPEQYAAAVAEAVRQIGSGLYSKVVLARSLRVDAPGFDPAPVVRALAGREPGAYTFGADLGDGRTLFGASPELLIARRGKRIIAHPLAGSIPRGATPAEDARRAATLMRSTQARHEHARVVEAVSSTLRPLCGTLTVPPAPSLVATATMWHLGTMLTGTVADPSISSLALATALHPIPAVCGTPPAPARAAIAALETFDRGFYTGAVGWTDASGDGEWAVTIRCAVADADGLDLYAGAGVVAGSDPAAVLNETTAKLGTVLDAVGIERPRKAQESR